MRLGCTGRRGSLEQLIERETHADRCDTFRVALLTLRGREKLEIAELLGMSVALQAPRVSTRTMSVFSKTMSAELDPADHAVVIMDQAGWHKVRKLAVPANITILYLPPYSPELNPVENLWGYLRSHYMRDRVRRL